MRVSTVASRASPSAAKREGGVRVTAGSRPARSLDRLVTGRTRRTGGFALSGLDGVRAVLYIPCPRENPKTSHLRKATATRIDSPVAFRVLTWTEYRWCPPSSMDRFMPRGNPKVALGLRFDRDLVEALRARGGNVTAAIETAIRAWLAHESHDAPSRPIPSQGVSADVRRRAGRAEAKF